MNEHIIITIQPFGAIKKYSKQPIIIHLHNNSKLLDLRMQIINKLTELNANFTEQDLIYDSAFASDTHILSETFVFTQNITLAILPPVCGG